jgi:hypothetical protein
MGSGHIWCHPTLFFVPFLSSFVYADEQHSDTCYKKQKANEKHYQLVSIHKSNVVRDAERKGKRPGMQKARSLPTVPNYKKFQQLLKPWFMPGPS